MKGWIRAKCGWVCQSYSEWIEHISSHKEEKQ